MKPQYKKLLLWTVLVLHISLIFSFSLQNAKKSSSVSKWFTNNVKTMDAFEQEVAAEKKENGETRYHESVVKKVAKKRYGVIENFIRKGAHFSLFFVLGAILMMLIRVYGIRGIFQSILCLLFGMSVAFFDETLQLFSKGRAGLIGDVFIDTAGVAAAIAVLLIGGLVYEKIKNRRSEMDN